MAEESERAASGGGDPFLIDRIGFVIGVCWLVLAFTTALADHFTLPKLLGLHVFAAFTGARWLVHLRAGRVGRLPGVLGVATALLALWWVITTFLAQDVTTALYGVHGRYNGLFTMLVALGLFVATASVRLTEEEVEARLGWLGVAVAGAAAYALVQAVGLDPLRWPPGRPPSTVGHPVTLGALIAMALPFLLAFLVDGRTPRARRLAGVAFIAAALALFASLARGPWVGAVAGLALMGALAAPQRARLARPLMALGVAVLLVGGIVLVGYGGAGGRLMERVTSFTRLSQDASVAARQFFLRAGLDMVRDHPWTGIGLENFALLYPRYRSPAVEPLAPDVIPTMVHSGYVQTAASGGVLALVLYVAVLTAAALRIAARRRASRDARQQVIGAAFLGSLCAFAVQDLGGWPDVALGALAWTTWGLGVAWSVGGEPRPAPRVRWGVALMACALCAGSAWLAIDAAQRIRADRLILEARRLHPVREWAEAQARLQAAIAASPDKAWARDTAAALYQQRVALAGDRAAYDEGVRLTEQARADNRFDPYMRVRRVELDIAALERRLIATITDGAKQAIVEAKYLDPYNATILESEARLALAAGFGEAGLGSIRQALQLRPNSVRFRMLEGDALRALGRRDECERAYREAAGLAPAGSPEAIGVRRRLVYVLIEAKRFGPAVEEAKALVAMANADAVAWALLGIAWEGQGVASEARVAFSQALALDPTNAAARDGLARLDRATPVGR